jgi:RNA polymerase sigma factor (TIGR02999 family)
MTNTNRVHRRSALFSSETYTAHIDATVWDGFLGFKLLAKSRSFNVLSDVTQILDRVCQGDSKAAEELLPLVYNELRKLAAFKMSNERAGQTLQPTALVHEAWLKLAGASEQQWRNRKHFFGAAAEAMRRILIDRARKRNRSRHGHGLERIDLSQVDVAIETDDEVLLAVDEALGRLAVESPERAELVKLRYYVGLSIPDAAEMLGISESTAKRQWNYVRAWLFRELNGVHE